MRVPAGEPPGKQKPNDSFARGAGSRAGRGRQKFLQLEFAKGICDWLAKDCGAKRRRCARSFAWASLLAPPPRLFLRKSAQTIDLAWDTKNESAKEREFGSDLVKAPHPVVLAKECGSC